MVTGQDLIYFNNPDDWSLAVDTTETATSLGVNSYSPIETFDLDVTLNNTHIAILVTTSRVRTNWRYAGELVQVYDFPKGNIDQNTGKVLSQPYDLLLDKLTVLDVSQISLDPSRLLFTPPNWFRDVTVKVYVYTGNIDNFTKDSIANITNILEGETAVFSQELKTKIDELTVSIQEFNNGMSGIDCNVDSCDSLAEINDKLDLILSKLDCSDNPTNTDSTERKTKFFLMN